MKDELNIHTTPRNFHVDFFQLVSDKDENIFDYFQKVESEESGSSYSNQGVTRELWNLSSRSKPKSITGMLRKFRTSDLPEIGSIGEAAKELLLEEGQALIEFNYFIYYKENQILAWVRNGNGSTPNQFSVFLRSLWETNIKALPLIERNALKRLMSGKVEVKNFEVTLSKPTADEFHPEYDISKKALELVSSSGADSLSFKLGVKLKDIDNKGTWQEEAKGAAKELLSIGASRLKLEVLENGFEHPIDLIADRISSKQSVDTNGKYAPSASMYKMIDAAQSEKKEAIDALYKRDKKALA